MKKTSELQIVLIDKLIPYANNARKHSENQISKIRSSLREFGFVNPVIIDRNYGIIAGHGRVLAAKAEGIKEIPCVFVDYLTEAQKKAYILADNRLALDADWDEEILKLEIESLKEFDFDVSLTGFDIAELDEYFGEVYADTYSVTKKDCEGNLSKRFLFSPFSILDTRRKEWLERKNFWINDIGIRSSESRENMKTLGSFSGSVPGYYDKKAKCEEKLGRKVSHKEFCEKYLKDFLPKNSTIDITIDGGILSIFDPVLCELMYYWFAPELGSILDPFSGGNVRGLIAALTGHNYTGVDIRQEQIVANKKSAEEILKGKGVSIPQYICGDSLNIKSLASGNYDMIFSCPPYFDLEKYSDNPSDLSNMNYNDFLKCYQNIINQSCQLLKDNRFAVFVVGDIRNQKTGMYRNFVSQTISAFNAAGLELYNEIILVQQIGSLPIRASYSFSHSRKVGKMHQNILVFYKGNQKEIKNVFGEINISIPETDKEV